MRPVTAELYSLVQQFYARQTHALDSGNVKEFAETFAEDAVVRHSSDIPPAESRAEIVAVTEAYKEAEVNRRHYFNQLLLTPLPDESIRATFYALIVNTRRGETVSHIQPSCLVEDILTVNEDVVLLHSRYISFD